MRPILLISLLLLLPAPRAAAGAEKDGGDAVHEYEMTREDNEYAMSTWRSGWYMTTGLGYSLVRSISNDTQNKSYAGCHVMPAVGYWFGDHLGIEVGAIISFGYFHDMTVVNYQMMADGVYHYFRIDDFSAYMWDTSLYLGILLRLPFFNDSETVNPFLRLFSGYGMSVFWLRGLRAPEYLEAFSEEIDDYTIRFHGEGYITGLGLGNVFPGSGGFPCWFLQLTLVLELFQDIVTIRDGGVLPQELYSVKNRNNLHNVHVHLSAGIRFF
ncbi:MAG: hypothetical protein JXA20_01355 [Spirochaetes bacterium]|nr:hypothetical protein [Spirochaetota bacterium]